MSASLLPILAGDTPGERLASLRAALPGRIVFTTSFGIEDQALTHEIFSRDLAIDLVTIDTGRLFLETYELWQETEERYGRRIRSVHPDAVALAAMVADAGINGFYFSKDARLNCCAVRKVEPLNRALAGAFAWVTGLRADQSDERGAVTLVSRDPERGLIKVAPLFDWSRDEVAEFCAAHKVPVSALHDFGYASIGCAPCTRAIQPGEPERAGRWWWEKDEARECGLHVGADGRLQRSRAA
jgi:phosphoadenosine phosphosulfate reductase